jgi:hypothetical protein
MSQQPSARNMWRPDSEFWSANRAEHRFADGHELVAFDLPAANGYPAIIGRELFGGTEYMTLQPRARPRASVKPRTHAKRRWFKRWRLSDIRRWLRLQIGEYPRSPSNPEPTPGARSYWFPERNLQLAGVTGGRRRGSNGSAIYSDRGRLVPAYLLTSTEDLPFRN